MRGDLHCAFKMMRKNPETGEVEDLGCQKCGGRGHDEYAIYPEFKGSMIDFKLIATDGRIVNNDTNPYVPSDMKIGPTVIWENISGHNQNGLNFDFRDFPADSYLHPLYHREERNVPLSSMLDTDDVGEIFGGTEPVLVVPGWNIETFYGHDRVEVCRQGIYGRYDEGTDMVLPKCLRSYTRDIPNWVDYSGRDEWFMPREFFVDGATDESIVAFCHKHFADTTTAERMADALKSIRNGDWINVTTLMTNNFASDSERRDFMEVVSLKTRRDLYKGSVNLQRYCELYTYLDRAEWISSRRDENGKEVQEVKKIPKDICVLFKQNLMNWILNSPTVQNIMVGNESYGVRERYWYVSEMLRKAKKEKVLDRKVKLPKWLIKQFTNSRNDKKVFDLFGETYDYDEAPKELKDEYVDSIILRLKEGPKQLYPGMLKVRDIIDSGKSGPIWFSFLDILNAGRRWNVSEIQTAWDYFQRAWMQEDPSIFWNWVDDMESLPYETEYSVSQDEFVKKLEKLNGIAMHYPEFQEVIPNENGKPLIGALELGLGDSDISPSRTFAKNLLECQIDDDTFDVIQRNTIDVYDGRARVKHRRECSHETFWNELARVGLAGDKAAKATLSRETHEEFEATRNDSTVTQDSTLEGGFDNGDLDGMKSQDPYSGELSSFEGGPNIWQDEE